MPRDDHGFVAWVKPFETLGTLQLLAKRTWIVLQVHELPFEVLDGARVHEAAAHVPCQVLLQVLGVVLQDLSVDQLPHILHGQLAAVKLKGQLADGLR